VLTEKLKNDAATEFGSAGTMLNGRYLAPPKDHAGEIWVRRSTLIQAEPALLYEMWRNLEAVPKWQEGVSKVFRSGDKTFHWVMSANGVKIEWEVEILADEPGTRITWRSIGGDLENAGEVIFEPSVGNRGTIVTVLQQFRMGKVTSLWTTITGSHPRETVIDNLRHFKALAETEEIPRTQGQPHGPRGVVGMVKQSLYREKTTSPAGKRAS
jgi:uncharacterized membrane protein